MLISHFEIPRNCHEYVATVTRTSSVPGATVIISETGTLTWTDSEFIYPTAVQSDLKRAELERREDTSVFVYATCSETMSMTAETVVTTVVPTLTTTTTAYAATTVVTVTATCPNLDC